MNLYPIKTKGYFIYKKAARNERYTAMKKYPSGFTKSALLYSLEEAIEWINALPESCAALRAGRGEAEAN